MHPLCTQFPPSIRHVVHLSHPLVFQKSYTDAYCCVCNTTIRSYFWRYRCGCCDGFDVHVECVALHITHEVHVECGALHIPHEQLTSDDTTSRRLPPWAGLYTYGGVSSAVNSQNIYHQTTPPCHVYNPYGGVPSLHNLYGHGMYAQQPHQFYGQMPHYINPYYNMCNPSVGLPYYTNPHNMYNEAPPCDLNSQNGQIHHGDTSHQGQANNGQNGPARVQKIGKKVFKIVASLTLGVVSNVIFGALMIAL